MKDPKWTDPQTLSVMFVLHKLCTFINILNLVDFVKSEATVKSESRTWTSEGLSEKRKKRRTEKDGSDDDQIKVSGFPDYSFCDQDGGPEGDESR